MRFLLALSSALLIAGMVMHWRDAGKPGLRYTCYIGGLIGLIIFQAFVAYPWSLLCIGLGTICGCSWYAMDYGGTLTWRTAGRIILALGMGVMFRLLQPSWTCAAILAVAQILHADDWMEARWNAFWHKSTPSPARRRTTSGGDWSIILKPRTPAVGNRRPQPATA